jgi:hypothetical protein
LKKVLSSPLKNKISNLKKPLLSQGLKVSKYEPDSQVVEYQVFTSLFNTYYQSADIEHFSISACLFQLHILALTPVELLASEVRFEISRQLADTRKRFGSVQQLIFIYIPTLTYRSMPGIKTH